MARAAVTLALVLTILGAGPATVLAETAPRCSHAAPGALTKTITTRGSVLTRAGTRIAFQADVGIVRVEGGDVAEAADNAPAPTAAGERQRVGAPDAKMSYVAYFANDGPASRRPVMFVWDGGPGASSRAPLLASFGPVHAVLPEPGEPVGSPPGPAVVSNPDTLLDVADLVFVDPPGAGFGWLEGCGAPRRFYGVDADAAAFQQFIRRFLVSHHRTGSPVFLFGESYGSVRAAIVARRLGDAGTPVAGIVLLSQMLALDAWSDGASANVGTENGFFLTLPSFAAAAWWHGKVPHDGNLETWLSQAESFALTDYGPALLLGAKLAPERKAQVASRLAAYTGLSVQTWLDADLRIEASRFRDLLEADQGRLIGREDTRYEGPAPKVRTDAVSDDPLGPAIHSALAAAFDGYVRGTLGVGGRPFTPYITGPDIRWDMHHVTDPAAWPDTYVNAAPDLAAAMRRNPKLRVLVTGGHYDLATPYLGAIYMVDHLPIEKALRANIEWQFYLAGHSAYMVDSARRDLHDRVARLVAVAITRLTQLVRYDPPARPRATLVMLSGGSGDVRATQRRPAPRRRLYRTKATMAFPREVKNVL